VAPACKAGGSACRRRSLLLPLLLLVQVGDMIGKMAKKGMTPSQIGVLLRDSHGIAQVKSVTGSKILRILKGQGECCQLLFCRQSTGSPGVVCRSAWQQTVSSCLKCHCQPACISRECAAIVGLRARRRAALTKAACPLPAALARHRGLCHLALSCRSPGDTETGAKGERCLAAARPHPPLPPQAPVPAPRPPPPQQQVARGPPLAGGWPTLLKRTVCECDRSRTTPARRPAPLEARARFRWRRLRRLAHLAGGATHPPPPPAGPGPSLPFLLSSRPGP
jgi:hypothetical protein